MEATAINNPPLSHSTTGLIAFLDTLLRRPDQIFEEIFNGKDVARRIRTFLFAIAALSAFYGLTMGLIGFMQEPVRGALQSLSSAVKVPMLYLASLAVCFPVLYVVLVLMGMRLKFSQALALVLLALTLNSVILASCAPIIIFFTITGSDYHFIKLLHVGIFVFSGGWGMFTLWQGLTVMCEKSDLYPKQALKILKIWVLVFGFVGTQMAWSLRPFVGSPNLEFQIFRADQTGNLYQAVANSAAQLAKDVVKD